MICTSANPMANFQSSFFTCQPHLQLLITSPSWNPLFSWFLGPYPFAGLLLAHWLLLSFSCWISLLFLICKCWGGGGVPGLTSLSTLSLYLTSSNPIALKTIYKLSTPKFNFQPWHFPWTLDSSYCLFNISTWLCNRHFKFHMSKIQLCFPHSSSFQ